jgi:M6 family metalloprotease-like protein
MILFRKMTAAVIAAGLLLSSSSLFVSSAEKRTYYRGDVNLDGVIDILDMIVLQKYILGYGSFDSETAALCADSNGDGSVDVYDVGLVKQYVLKERRLEELGEKFIPAPLTDFYGTMPSQGSGRLLVFYVDFPDCQYDYAPTVEELRDICFGTEDNPDDPNYPFESMRSFYKRSSKGVFDLTGAVCRYTAKNSIAYYEVGDDGKTDKEMTRLLTELFQYFNRSIDFNDFDGNKDGYIDAILVNVPGKANEDIWWPFSGFNYSKLEADGVKIGHVITGFDQVESPTDHKRFVSTYLHETGHCMGLPDYYLFHTEDKDGFHGPAGYSLMDEIDYSDFDCFSKLMLGWYRKRQVQVYDQETGGVQTFSLTDAQSAEGNCLILPCGELDSGYNSEYIILEYTTDTVNNIGINRDKGLEQTFSGGVRAFHVRADAGDEGYGIRHLYRSGGSLTNGDDDGIRLLRLVNEAEGGTPFGTGDVLDSRLSGFRWYDWDESESLETGYTVTIGALENGSYTVTVDFAGN